MTTIQFYHLTATPLERALPKLLEKAYGGGFTTLLVADSEEYVEHLNQLLWTYDPGSFLPHGSVKDGNVEQQPILLVTAEFLQTYPPLTPPVHGGRTLPPRPRGGWGGESYHNLLLVTNGAIPENPNDFERILDIFDGNDTQAVAKARTRWTDYKKNGCELAYLRQTESGGWEKKA